jgi:GT2 family glycosyltransferase
MTNEGCQLSVTVIIPVHNGNSGFRRCLSRVTRAVPPPAEIIVVDDGSTDSSAAVAAEFGASVLGLAARGGPATARNAGARAAAGDVLFFVDADVVLPPDAVGQVIEAFEEEPHLAALFGSYDDAPAAANFLSQFKNLSHHYFHQASSKDACTFWGACGAIRREIFLAAGGFDEAYRVPCVEDIELGYRLKTAGHRIRLCKSLQVQHLKVWTAAALLKADLFRRAVPWTELILRHPELARGLNLGMSSRLSVLAAYGLVAALAGAWWWRGALAVAGAFAAALAALNAPLYRFYWRKRGWRFALKAIPWNWLYYLYGGLGFAIGLARHGIARLLPRRRVPASEPDIATDPEQTV